MTQSEIANFLKAGALLRMKEAPGSSGEARVMVWQGPFSSLEDKNSSEFSISYQDFFGSKLSLLKAAAVRVLSVKELRKACQTYVSTETGSEDILRRQDFKEPELPLFQDSFQVIQGKIHRGEIEKAVPVVFAESSKTPSLKDRANMIDKALESFSELYAFGFWQEDMGIIGATPEVLFHQKDQQIESMALAGTCPKAEAANRVSLLKDPKEMQEHNLVLKDIEERLSKWGWVKVGETEMVEFPNLFHLRTSLSVSAAKTSPFDLLKALHPTPALGVSPRNYGIQWMKDLAYQKDRMLFGAPITFSLSETETISLVAIRNLHWHSGKSYVGSGCGIVAASDLQREWQELSTKRESVFKVLGIQ